MVKRRPLTSTRLRFAPRPRRFSVAPPVPWPLLNLPSPWLPRNCGVSLSVSSILILPDSLICSSLTTVTGVGAWKVLDRREPVTTTVSPLSCASAGALHSARTTPVPHKRRARICPKRPIDIETPCFLSRRGEPHPWAVAPPFDHL